MDLFVPGRICLFGEHSDWAGGHRRTNEEIGKGYTIITGTNQGLHARVKPHPDKLILTSSTHMGEAMGPCEIPMDRELLLEEARKGSWFSYAAGVAYQVLTHYRVRGLEIDNYRTDLPIQKGLSSSAAVCVMVARAFNRVYDLKMTVRGEMEFAYLGEITTPSRCGRMDQGCAYGNRPILMTFDGDRSDVEEFGVPQDLHFLIVDLCAHKDTREILKRLNACYPFADNEVQRGVQEYLGPVSEGIVKRAMEALQEGDAEAVGRLMTEAQAEFDRSCIPACPSELTSPRLHELLNHEPLKPYVLGGKGVGSQGDGTAQFIVRNARDQKKAMEIIERDLGMKCLKLVIGAGRKIRKAIIPAAGFGTRLYPATKGLKKEFFPIMSADGRMKPVILAIVEEAVNAGVEEIGIVTRERDHKLFEDFFGAPPAIENFNKLSKENQEYTNRLMDIGRRITLLNQDVQDGFGHAVHCGRKWVGRQPFLLMLGDHLYASAVEKSCVEQLLDVFEKTGKSVVGLKAEPVEAVRRFGCVAGKPHNGGDILEITEFKEKPDREYAEEHLMADRSDEDGVLTVFGLYVLTPRIFKLLGALIRNNKREQGEFQLTTCLEELRKIEGFVGLEVKGERFDVGNPEAYRKTMASFGGA